MCNAVAYWFFFPDSPTNAWFLTPEERIIAVERIKVNQSGVENKTFKRNQLSLGCSTLARPRTFYSPIFVKQVHRMSKGP